MPKDSKSPLSIVIIVMPGFNLAATVNFIDPFRAANYLDGQTHFRWSTLSISGGAVVASNGMTLDTKPLSLLTNEAPDIAIVSASWAPESHSAPELNAALRRWARAGITLGALDTGAFILAKLRLLDARRATVHYEHLDAFKELHPDIDVSDQLFVIDGDRITCCGGEAAADCALHLIRRTRGDTLANSAARYLFHESLRSHGARQSARSMEPLGNTDLAARSISAGPIGSASVWHPGRTGSRVPYPSSFAPGPCTTRRNVLRSRGACGARRKKLNIRRVLHSQSAVSARCC